ncbi:carboxylating nicotinate-nucleotide diphosphorylase [Marinobacterium lutimaris]|uniref:Probable nicotinate-nucleotide pyrophosphorylase [carboxylating] n=1 Tax=Marinobacterium lutimaris TaxID=568106 RepID=A0A1H6CC09_9GAMM|nr:carboxylating nicotinate-nucleotide diphosphorylase [Marinobacterium lutimaris]SEG70511.1 nicotinate-nucleotide pyrophosphorylase [carboxylating] [Marinobacterium lutimaris]
MLNLTDLKPVIEENVRTTLSEDVGDGDITAALIPASDQASGRVISREYATVCGTAWVDEVFRQVDPEVRIEWKVKDGDQVEPDQTLFTIEGAARSLLTGERAALNFLQTLSGTATLARSYADHVAETSVRLLDTRKTIPGLRMAQKYAVSCGGCFNHRIGLFDAFLIKENHILACGGISAAVSTARTMHADKPVEVEVEDQDQLVEALEAGADIIMLDNFSPAEMVDAVTITAGRAKLEASGNITDETLLEYAKTGVDYISIGALTKHCRAIDLSMRLV